MAIGPLALSLFPGVRAVQIERGADRFVAKQVVRVFVSTSNQFIPDGFPAIEVAGAGKLDRQFEYI